MLTKPAFMKMKWIMVGADVDGHDGAVKAAAWGQLPVAPLMIVDVL